MLEVVNQMDGFVHYLATTIGRPDGKFLLNHTCTRPASSDALYVSCIPTGFHPEYLHQGNPSSSPLFDHHRHPSVAVHVPWRDHPPNNHDCHYVPFDESLTQTSAAQGCVRVRNGLPEWLTHI